MSRRYKKFLLLCLASLVSATGSGMTSFSLGVYIYQYTGRSSMTGLLLLLGFLPGLLLTPFSGVLADRHDRRLLMMTGDGLSMLGVLTVLLSISLLHGNALILGIGAGVAVSSAFSSLVEPAFRATVSDLLDKEEYTKASAMTQLVSSARYLLSPVLAGFLLSRWGVRAVLVLDLLTILVTLPVTYLIRREMKQEKKSQDSCLKEELRLGLRMVYEKRGIWLLVVFGILVSFCLGTLQTLMTPMILAFADEGFLGFATTFSACGMLAGGLFLGIVRLKKGFSRILDLSLIFIGLCMIGFSLRENRSLLCAFGFLLFAAIPFANTSIDYLVRTNILAKHQGKVWGLIGILSQTGYVLAYATVGSLADHIGRPLLAEEGQALSRLLGTGQGRAAALFILLAGVLLILSAAVFSRRREIKELEEEPVLKDV